MPDKSVSAAHKNFTKLSHLPAELTSNAGYNIVYFSFENFEKFWNLFADYAGGKCFLSLIVGLCKRNTKIYLSKKFQSSLHT